MVEQQCIKDLKDKYTPFGADLQIEKEIIELGEIIWKMNEGDIFAKYQNLKKSAEFYRTSFDTYRTELYNRARFETDPNWSWTRSLPDYYLKINKFDLLEYYWKFFQPQNARNVGKTNKKDCKKASVWIYSRSDDLSKLGKYGSWHHRKLTKNETACQYNQFQTIDTLDTLRS